MTALYARITAALDEAWSMSRYEAPGPKVVAADRRVLARHAPCDYPALRDLCRHCYGWDWPCPDIVDLAARYDVQVTP